MFIRCDSKKRKFYQVSKALLEAFVNTDNIEISDKIDRPSQSSAIVLGEVEIFIPLDKLVDLNIEKSRMGKRIKDIERILSSINSKLSNENFIKRAPRTVIEKEKLNFDKLTKEMKKINHNLNMLS